MGMIDPDVAEALDHLRVEFQQELRQLREDLKADFETRLEEVRNTLYHQFRYVDIIHDSRLDDLQGEVAELQDPK